MSNTNGDNNWPSLRIGDFAKTCSGATPSRGNDSYYQGSIPWVKTGELHDGEIHESEEHVSSLALKETSLKLLPAGTLLVAMYGQGKTRGRTGLLMQPATTNQACFAILPDPERFDNTYLQLWFRRNYRRLREETESRGGNQPNLNGVFLRQQEVEIPPLSEQKRIAGILKEQLAAVERTRAAAEAQLEAAKALPASYLRDVFDSSEAKTWPVHEMVNLSTLVIDGPHVTPEYQTKGVPFLTVRNVVKRRIDMTDVSLVSEEDHAEFAARGRAERGDILYTKDGTLGVPCVVDTDERFSFFVSVALIKLRRDVVDPYFVAYALESPHVLKQVERLGAGAGLKHMVLRSIRALLVPVPSLERQQEIAKNVREKLTRSQTIQKLLELQLEEINAMPAALLRAAFQGQL